MLMNKETEINLVMIPFAGGNSYVYRNFKEAAASFLHLELIDLPGHGKRMREALLTNLDALVDDIYNHPLFTGDDIAPYALFGHSMGAVVSYLLAKRLTEEKNAPPVHMFFSGRQAPSVESVEKNLHTLTVSEFINKVLAYGGIPEEVAREKDLMDLFIPIMRADFMAVETYTFKDIRPLNAPATVFIGDGDRLTPYENIFKWQEVSEKPISVKTFRGGHFFLFRHMEEMADIMNNTLEEDYVRLNAFQGYGAE